MPLVTAALVRWAGGWAEVINASGVAAHGRIEALLGLGALSSPAEVVRVADAQLTTFGAPREEITAGILPIADTDTPYLSFRPGDTITVPDSTGFPTAERVMSMTVTVDDATGRVVYTPTLRDRLLDQSDRLAQATKKMINGTFGGASQVAQPVVPTAKPQSFLPFPSVICFADGFDVPDDPMIGATIVWTRAMIAYDLSVVSYLVPDAIANVGGTASLVQPDETVLGDPFNHFTGLTTAGYADACDVGSIDQVISCDWGYDLLANASLVLYARVDPSNGNSSPVHAFLHNLGDGTMNVSFFASGVHFGLGTVSAAPISTGNDFVEFQIIGDTGSIYVNGVLIATYSDSRFTTSVTPGNYGGFGLDASFIPPLTAGTIYIDNWSICAV